MGEGLVPRLTGEGVGELYPSRSDMNSSYSYMHTQMHTHTHTHTHIHTHLSQPMYRSNTELDSNIPTVSSSGMVTLVFFRLSLNMAVNLSQKSASLSFLYKFHSTLQSVIVIVNSLGTHCPQET